MWRVAPILLIGLGLLLILAAGGWLYFNNPNSNSGTVPLPYQVAGLARTEQTTGAQAITEFENLHGEQFPITFGSIGIYGNQQITLWVAGTPSNSVASDLVNAMQAKIAAEKSPFTLLEQRNQGTRSVYVLEGMGQRHYYFQSKNLVIWLASDPTVADVAIQQILEVYP